MDKKEEIAKLLLETRSVTFRFKEPYYRYSSGILSPIYCDNRRLLSLVIGREEVIEAFLALVAVEKVDFGVVAGVATAGIPFAAFLAERLKPKRPMVYVRECAKGHGKERQVEGIIGKDQQTLVIEDLITTGKSAVAAGKALREDGAIVMDCLAILTYQMEEAIELFRSSNIKLHALTDFMALISVAVQEGYITGKEREIVLYWHEDPQNWGRKMGYEE